MKKVYEQFPNEVALHIYRWLLDLSNKGRVTEIITDYSPMVINNWFNIRNTVRKNVYYMRLWKGLAAEELSSCLWCVNLNSNGKCYHKTCKYKYSMLKAADTFGLDYKELLFIRTHLGKTDRELFKYNLKKVDVLISIREETKYYAELFDILKKELLHSGHFNKLLRKAFSLKDFGVDSDDVLAEMYLKIFTLIRRYDYANPNTLVKICGTGMKKHLINIIKEHKDVYRNQFNNKKREVHFADKHDSNLSAEFRTLKIDVIPDDVEPLDVKVITSTYDIKALKVIKQVKKEDAVLGKAISLLLGGEDEDFINFLKEKERLKTKKGWKNFYDKVKEPDLMLLVNEFSGFFVDKKIRNIVKLKNVNVNRKQFNKGRNKSSIKESSTTTNLQGGRTMSKNLITVPKKKCMMCAHFIPFLNKKKWTPKDCTPAYPGCPVHLFEIVHAFPKRQAAIQLRIFIDTGEEEQIKSFIESCPNATEVMQTALALTESEIEEAQLQMMEVEEERIDVESMSLEEMKDFILDNEIIIKGIKDMSEDDLKVALQEKVDAIYAEVEDEEVEIENDEEDEDEDEDEDENDDEETDIKVVGQISESDN